MGRVMAGKGCNAMIPLSASGASRRMSLNIDIELKPCLVDLLEARNLIRSVNERCNGRC
jgi:hypothetical protein